MAVSNARKAWEGYSAFPRNQKGKIVWPKGLAIIPFILLAFGRLFIKIAKFIGGLLKDLFSKKDKEPQISLEEIQENIPDQMPSENAEPSHQTSPGASPTEAMLESSLVETREFIEKGDELLGSLKALIGPASHQEAPPSMQMEDTPEAPQSVPSELPESDEDASVPIGIITEELPKAAPASMVMQDTPIPQKDSPKQGSSVLELQNQLEKALKADVEKRQAEAAGQRFFDVPEESAMPRSLPPPPDAPPEEIEKWVKQQNDLRKNKPNNK